MPAASAAKRAVKVFMVKVVEESNVTSVGVMIVGKRTFGKKEMLEEAIA